MRNVVALKEDQLEIAPGQKVIELDDYIKFEKVENILEVAIKKADEMTERAQIAFQQQEELGYQEGLERAKAELIERLVESSKKSIMFLEALEKQTVEIVMMSVKKIIGDFDDVEKAEKIVRSMLSNVKSQADMVLRIAPSCAELAKKIENDTDHLNIVIDEQLADDNFILETPMGVLDGSMDVQLENLHKAIVTAFLDSS